MPNDSDEDEWGEWWDARVAAIEQVLGPSHDMVGHAPIPFDLGADIGGAADIIWFKHHLDGVVSVASELIGNDEQIQNSLGNYELMICHRDDEQWGGDVISQLVYYTLQAKLNPGDTMDIGSAVPDDSTIAAFLFIKYATFTVRDRAAGPCSEQRAIHSVAIVRTRSGRVIGGSRAFQGINCGADASGEANCPTPRAVSP
jgi:hypothetical protein